MNWKRPPIGIVFLMMLVALVATGRIYYKWVYPYGWSHCCIDIMMSTLQQYALDHGGHFPTGGSCPEASLSLLCKSNYIDPYTLRGMTVPENTVKQIFDNGGLLGPNTCGWQYVDGLTLADDSRLAILYCKTALGHNGQTTADGGRQVVFVDSEIKWISGSEWPAFLQEQKELLAKRDERAKAGIPLVDAIVELPDGRQVQSVGSYLLNEQDIGKDGNGSGSQSGSELDRNTLVWFEPPMGDKYTGTIIRTLLFSNLVSDPVKITFTKGIPDKTNIVFRMKAKN